MPSRASPGIKTFFFPRTMRIAPPPISTRTGPVYSARSKERTASAEEAVPIVINVTAAWVKDKRTLCEEKRGPPPMRAGQTPGRVESSRQSSFGVMKSGRRNSGSG